MTDRQKRQKEPTACLACGQRYYYEDAGETGDEGQQISPDTGSCSLCGFQYSQSTEGTGSAQAERYIRENFGPRFVAAMGVAVLQREQITTMTTKILQVAAELRNIGHGNYAKRLEQIILPLLWDYDYDAAEWIEEEE